MSDYIVLFDIGQEPFSQWWPIGLSAIPVLVGVAIVLLTRDVKRVIGIVVIALGAVSLAIEALSQLGEYNRLQESLEAGSFTEVQGRVEDFSPDPGASGIPQTFTVDGHRFELLAARSTSSFNATVGSGGPNLAGRCVRILVTDRNEIIWLGVRRTGCLEMAESERL